MAVPIFVSGQKLPAAELNSAFAQTAQVDLSNLTANGLTQAYDDGDAATKGVAVGHAYLNGSVLQIRVS